MNSFAPVAVMYNNPFVPFYQQQAFPYSAPAVSSTSHAAAATYHHSVALPQNEYGSFRSQYFMNAYQTVAAPSYQIYQVSVVQNAERKRRWSDDDDIDDDSEDGADDYYEEDSSTDEDMPVFEYRSAKRRRMAAVEQHTWPSAAQFNGATAQPTTGSRKRSREMFDMMDDEESYQDAGLLEDLHTRLKRARLHQQTPQTPLGAATMQPEAIQRPLSVAFPAYTEQPQMRFRIALSGQEFMPTLAQQLQLQHAPVVPDELTRQHQEYVRRHQVQFQTHQYEKERIAHYRALESYQGAATMLRYLHAQRHGGGGCTPTAATSPYQMSYLEESMNNLNRLTYYTTMHSPSKPNASARCCPTRGG